MRQIWITGHGGVEKLQVREAPDPQPASGELRIRVRASGINFADILARRGLYRGPIESDESRFLLLARIFHSPARLHDPLRMWHL